MTAPPLSQREIAEAIASCQLALTLLHLGYRYPDSLSVSRLEVVRDTLGDVLDAIDLAALQPRRAA